MYQYKVVKGSAILSTATTLAEARQEAARVGGTVMHITEGTPELEKLRLAVAKVRPPRSIPAGSGTDWTRHDKRYGPPDAAGARLVSSVDGVAVGSWKGGTTKMDMLGLEAATRDWIDSQKLPRPEVVLVEKVTQ